MNVRFLLYSLLTSIGLYFILWLIYFEQVQNTLIFFTSATFMLLYHVLLISSASIKNVKSEIFVFYIIFIFLFTGIFNAIFIDHRGDNFEFTGSDSLTYEKYSLKSLEFGYFEGLTHFLEESKYGYDDVGMIAYLSFLYRIVNDPLFPRFVNVLISIFTLLMIYSLARSCLEDDTAVVASLMFGAASYNVFYMASGLKETLFVFFIILSIYLYRSYHVFKKSRYLILAFVVSLFVFFFRIPTALFLIFSIAGAEFIRKSKSLIRVVSIGIIGASIVAAYAIASREFGGYFIFLNPDFQQTEEVSSGILFKLIGFVAGIFGPFPTIPTIAGKEADSLWAASLILKAFISIYAVYGAYLAFKTKKPILLVCVIFCLFNILALITIGKTFKVRYIIPYLPLFFLLAGYGYDKIVRHSEYRFLKKSVLPVNIGVLLLILFWNILRI